MTLALDNISLRVCRHKAGQGTKTGNRQSPDKLQRRVWDGDEERNGAVGDGDGNGKGRDEAVASKTNAAHQASDGCAQSKEPRGLDHRARLLWTFGGRQERLVQQPSSGEDADRGYSAHYRYGGGCDANWGNCGNWERGIRGHQH